MNISFPQTQVLETFPFYHLEHGWQNQVYSSRGGHLGRQNLEIALRFTKLRSECFHLSLHKNNGCQNTGDVQAILIDEILRNMKVAFA